MVAAKVGARPTLKAPHAQTLANGGGSPCLVLDTLILDGNSLLSTGVIALAKVLLYFYFTATLLLLYCFFTTPWLSILDGHSLLSTGVIALAQVCVCV